MASCRVWLLHLVVLSAWAEKEKCQDTFGYCDVLKNHCHHSNDEIREYAAEICPLSCGLCVSETDPNGVCWKDNGGCEHVCEVVDQKAVCHCHSGYKLHRDRKTCIDINECLEYGCSDGEHCFNFPGSFRCVKKCNRTFEKQYQDRGAGCCRIKSDEATCGFQQELPSNRAGVYTYRGQYPWQVLIERECGGTLISDEWIITSARCILPIVTIRNVSIRIMFNQKTSEQSHVVKKIVLHPNWNVTRLAVHDIALIQLTHPLESGSPICLPNGERPQAGKFCYSTGWSTVGESNYVAYGMGHAKVGILDHKSCATVLEDADVNLEYTLCTKMGNEISRECRADFGGPLVCQRCESCRWYVAGIFSYGRDCPENGEYQAFTDITFYEDWISNVTSIPITKDKSCIEPKFSNWSDWSECTQLCGGKRTRTRECKSVMIDGALKMCTGPVKQSKDCSSPSCPNEEL